MQHRLLEVGRERVEQGVTVGVETERHSRRGTYFEHQYPKTTENDYEDNSPASGAREGPCARPKKVYTVSRGVFWPRTASTAPFEASRRSESLVLHDNIH